MRCFRIDEIVVRTLETKPDGATHWSTRGMAKASGVSPSSGHRIWAAFSLQPHRTETFKLSIELQFVEKVRDVPQCVSKRFRHRPTFSSSAIDQRRRDPGYFQSGTGPSLELSLGTKAPS